jgi:hypothetical protein
MVDATKPSKLRVFGESELRDCQDYFLEIQSDSFGKTPNPTPDTRALPNHRRGFRQISRP